MTERDDQDEPIEDEPRPPSGRSGRPPNRASSGDGPPRSRPEPDDDLWDDDDEPVRPRRSRAARDVDPDDDRRPRPRSSGSGRQSARDLDDDGFDDDWDDDDDWDRGGRGGPGGPRRDLTYVVGIAAVVLIIALVVVLANKGNNKDDSKANSPTTQATQAGQTPTTGHGGFCGNLPPQLGGQGKVAVSGKDGVYLWSDFFGVHVRAKGPDVTTVKITATAPIKVKDTADPKNKEEKKLYDASYAAWSAAAGNGASATSSGNILTITVPAGSAPLGPNLDVPCPVTNMTISVSTPAGPVAADTIHLGDTGAAPRNPFDIQREAS
ncbi:MAG TPA: hypothetical protein VGM93_11080 [Acidimicrobiales bacterium]|jgi:hypothetical protein